MKTKLFTVFSATALVMLAMFSVAQAQAANMQSGRDGAEERGAPGEPMLISAQEQERNGNSDDGEMRTKEQERTQEQEREHATSTDASEEDDSNATSSEDMDDDELSGDEHRSDVATFVKSLLRVADRDGGIGEKVREVAREQNETASTTAEAIEKVSKKGKIATFFFGSDYKNLGQLRSELVTTENNIEKLRDLVDEAANIANKTELEAQVKILEETKAKVDAFITEHESAFSLFGWVARMFAK